MNRQYTVGVIVLIAIVGAFAWYLSRGAAPAAPGAQPQSTTTPAAAMTTTTSTTPSSSKPAASGPFTFALVAGDKVASWSFQGAYTGNADLTQKGQVEIARLSSMLGAGKYPDYELYVSIADQYDLLGDGAKEYSTLEKALAIDSTHTGIAWYNMGQLLSRLGANRTARVAFENAVDAQPAIQYIQNLIDFLRANFPQDTADIQKALKLLQTQQATTTAQ